jgi:hypothetical protein
VKPRVVTWIAWLAGFVAINALVGNGLLAWSAASLPRQSVKPTTLSFTASYLRRQAGSDSWMPMRLALGYLHAPHTVPLYTELLLNRGVKFQYPPTSLVLLEPLRLLGISGDGFLNALSWLAVAATAVLVAWIFKLSAGGGTRLRGPPGEMAALVGLGFAFTLTFYPVVRAYHIGQIQTWINPLFAAGLLAWLTGHRRASGALFGVICAIKPPLALLLVWAALRRQKQFAQGIGLVLVPLAVVSLWLYGWADCADYLSALVYLGRHGESFHQNQSVNGLLHRLLFNGNNLVWSGNEFPPYHLAVYVGTLVSSFLLIGAALFWRRSQADPGSLEDLMIAGLSFSMAAPIVWDHHYGIALPIFAAALPAVLRSPRFGAGSRIALAAAFLLLANRYRILEVTAATVFNVAQSTMLLGALLLLVMLYRLRGDRAAAEAV